MSNTRHLISTPRLALATLFLSAITELRPRVTYTHQREDPKPTRKCRLPSCYLLTRHNGGYCSPDHCRQHRAEKGRPT